MKKLIIILLVGMLSLGLSGIVYAADQSISVKISDSVALTPPSNVTSADWTLGAATTTTLEALAVVDANCPYNLTVQSTDDAKMTGNDTDSTNIAAAFKLGFYSGHGSNSYTSYDGTLGLETTVATSGESAQILFSEPLAPAEGQDSIGIKFSQVTVLGDPAYDGTTQIEYSITLTWTASIDLS